MTPSITTLLASGVLLSGLAILFVCRPRPGHRRKPLMSRSPHADLEFDALPNDVARAVRQVFASQPIYTDTIEKEDGAFSTTVRRNKWVLGTEMIVELRPSGARTSVGVRVNTQWFVRNDAVHTHDEYLYDFLAALREEIGTAVS